MRHLTLNELFKARDALRVLIGLKLVSGQISIWRLVKKEIERRADERLLHSTEQS